MWEQTTAVVVLGGLEVSEKCSGSIPHVAGYKVWLINWSIRHVHTDNLHIAVYTGTINLHHLRHYYLTCIQVGYLGDVPNKALYWFLSIVVQDGELGTKVTEHWWEHTTHRAGDELVDVACVVHILDVTIDSLNEKVPVLQNMYPQLRQLTSF